MANNNGDVSGFVVRGVGGVVDEAGTVAVFQTALREFIAAEQADAGLIGDVVDQIFDRPDFRGKAINLPTVAGYVLQELNRGKEPGKEIVTPENYGDMQEKVLNFIRANSGEVGSGSKFVIAKGKGGGVRRQSDIKVEAAKGTTTVVAPTAAAPLVTPAAPAPVAAAPVQDATVNAPAAAASAPAVTETPTNESGTKVAKPTRKAS